jgi:hypothetical protein
MPSPLMKKGDESRPESLQKNLYKIKTPYDLTDDIVTKSLNLLQNITGYDYRNNPVIDIIERLVDAKNSKLVVIGGERLLVEFGRRAANNVFDKFMPSPTNLVGDLKSILKTDFKKKDASITDPTKNRNRGLTDELLEDFVGYRDNDSYLITEYSKVKNTESSDVNYKFSGDIIKEKILQLNKNSVFSNHNVKTTSKIEFNNQSLIFKNTYSEDFVNQNPDNKNGLYDGINTITDTYTKTYFKPYENPNSTSLTKNYRQERKELENSQGFGSLGKMDGFRTADTRIKTNTTGSTISTTEFHYNSNEQNTINTNFGVRRGLVYFTSKLAKENPVISQDNKILYTDTDVNPNVVYYKGNGDCRTFTIYDQYDNFNRVIKFEGNNEKNSVLRESVLPRIAPMIGDRESEKHRYFFTMENLAVKVTQNDDCDKGPNGGRWMWFVPYNVKISDNNSVNWADLNFLGRPEPIFSYQNTVRSLSLSFSLLIDTVKEMQDVKPTIDEYYKYIYGCSQEPEPNEEGIPKTEPKPDNTPKPKRDPDPIPFDSEITYFFKNDEYNVRYINIAYTSGDNCREKFENGEENFYNKDLSGITSNDNFLGKFTAATQFLVDNIPKCKEIQINIKGLASKLFTKKTISNSAQYNSDLGYRRAYDMLATLIEYFNANRGSLEEISFKSKTLNYKDLEGIKPMGKTFKEEFNINGCKIICNLKSKGDRSAVGNYTWEKRNDGLEIRNRTVSITSINAYPKEDFDSNPNPDKQTVEQKDKISRNDISKKFGLPCDPVLTPKFEKLTQNDKFPVGYEKLNTFTPSFNSQTPFDFTKRYVFLHQLTRPAKLPKDIGNKVDNIVFGRMPVFILRYGDFLHTKAIARSINFDISEATFDFNPEGMGAIPLMCNVTMDLTLLGGQSLAGPIDRIQTANDSSFIANTSFNSGRYKDNVRFTSSRGQEFLQYKDRASGQDTTEKTPIGSLNSNDAVEQPIEVIPLEERGTSQPFVDPRTIPQPYDNIPLIELMERAVRGDDELFNKYEADKKKIIIIDRAAKEAQKQAEREAEEARRNMQSPVRINPLIGF